MNQNSIVGTTSKAFAVLWKELERWDPASFHNIQWHWPENVMKPIGSVLKARKEKVSRQDNGFADLVPITIHFDGSIEPRKMKGTREYSMELFWAQPGDVLLSKIDLKNGAVGVLPADLHNAVVTGHFAVYEPDLSQLVPEYLHLIVQTPTFKEYLWRNKVGAEGRKEVKLDFLLSRPIPLPSTTVQQAIVARWQQAQDDERAAQARIAEHERAMEEQFLADLGLIESKRPQIPKCFALKWTNLERWSLDHLARMVVGLSANAVGSYKMVPLAQVCKSQSGGTPSKSNRLFWRGDIPWVSPKDMKTWEIKDTIDHISEEAVASSSAPLIPANSVLIVVRSGILQRIVPIAINKRPVSINQDLRAFTPKTEELLAEFLAFYLTARQQDLLRLVKTGVTVESINKEELQDFTIPLPPLSVQRRLLERVEAQRAHIKHEREAAVHAARQSKVEIEALILGTKNIDDLSEGYAV